MATNLRHRRAKSTDESASRANAPAELELDELGYSPDQLVPSGWLPPRARAWIFACRPWSLPASIVPVALAGCLVHRQQGVDLLSGNFVAAAMMVLCVHAAANLANTYFDYQHGVDKKETADDRGLVDATVDAPGVLVFAMCLFGFGALLCAWLVAQLSAASATALLWCTVPAFALSFFYTAGPYCLKSLGLGDVTTFLCFGPLLMSAVALAVQKDTSTSGVSVPTLVLVYSLPIGLLTVAILHANNIRDLKADKDANQQTFALWLGKENSVRWYTALIVVSYGWLVLLPIVGGSDFGSMKVLAVLLCGPWANYLLRSCQTGKLLELPQRTAQHNLLLGTILIASLVPEPMFLGRLCLGALFYLGGVNNILLIRYITPLVQQKLHNLFASPDAHSKLPTLLATTIPTMSLIGAIVLQIGGGLGFIFGYHPRECAMALLLFLVPITFIVHDFWSLEGSEPGTGGKGGRHFPDVVSRRLPNFPSEFDGEFVHFFKNVGMIGGLLIYLESGVQ